MNWGVRLAGTIGTLMAVIVALFGEKLRAFLFKPRLVLEMVSPVGDPTPVTIKSDQGTRQEQSRYYHVRVRNQVQWPQTTDVQIFLLRIEEPGPDGLPQVKWSGEVPLAWQHAEIYEARRTVGPPAVADLCRVVRGKWLDVPTMIYPSSMDPYRIRIAGVIVNMTVVLQARGSQGESPITPFPITWTGQWADGDAEMARHFIIKDVTPIPVEIGVP